MCSKKKEVCWLTLGEVGVFSDVIIQLSFTCLSIMKIILSSYITAGSESMLSIHLHKYFQLVLHSGSAELHFRGFFLPPPPPITVPSGSPENLCSSEPQVFMRPSSAKHSKFLPCHILGFDRKLPQGTTTRKGFPCLQDYSSWDHCSCAC